MGAKAAWAHASVPSASETVAEPSLPVAELHAKGAPPSPYGCIRCGIYLTVTTRSTQMH